jgi:hypothetical protein
MTIKFRIAVALAAAALAAPALAFDDPARPATNPAPGIALHGSGRAEAQALNADPTWPQAEFAAPAVALPRLATEDSAGTVLGDEPWASAAQEPVPSRLASK